MLDDRVPARRHALNAARPAMPANPARAPDAHPPERGQRAGANEIEQGRRRPRHSSAEAVTWGACALPSALRQLSRPAARKGPPFLLGRRATHAGRVREASRYDTSRAFRRLQDALGQGPFQRDPRCQTRTCATTHVRRVDLRLLDRSGAWTTCQARDRRWRSRVHRDRFRGLGRRRAPSRHDVPGVYVRYDAA